MRRALLSAAFVAALPGVAQTQGALAVQGYGYPTGQLSTASLGVGGSMAELDPASPLNPAAIAQGTRYSVYMMFEPEMRRTSVPGGSTSTRTMRFPNFLVSGMFRRFAMSASASTYLDRTWSNTYLDSTMVGGELVPSTMHASSDGAMTDARFAAGWWFNERFQVGASVHALVGENRTQFGRSFPDSTGLGGVTQVSDLSFSGKAVTLGAIYHPMRGLVVGGSMRFGGSIAVEQDGLEVASADAPDRLGLSVAWTGIPNTTIAARFEKTNWNAMDALGSTEMTTFDANDLGLGVEVVGPRVGGAASFARLGLRSRTLPFGANGERVSENGLSGGYSIPLARGRSQIDLGLSRVTRRADGASEKAWLVSFGFGIRP